MNSYRYSVDIDPNRSSELHSSPLRGRDKPRLEFVSERPSLTPKSSKLSRLTHGKPQASHYDRLYQGHITTEVEL